MLPCLCLPNDGESCPGASSTALCITASTRIKMRDCGVLLRRPAEQNRGLPLAGELRPQLTQFIWHRYLRVPHAFCHVLYQGRGLPSLSWACH